jgi:hypothetical protein
MIRQILYYGFLTACFSVAGAAQGAAPFDRSALPLSAGAPEKFVPAGWLSEETVTGDLNADGTADTALVLIEKPGAKVGQTDSRKRVLLILLQTRPGELERAATAESLLACTICSGVLNATETAPEIRIRNGVLIYKLLIGSRESTDLTLRFRFDPKTKKFPLIGFDSVESDGATGASTRLSTNYLTGVSVTEEYQWSQKLDKDVRQSSKQRKVNNPAKDLENVDYEEMLGEQ